MDLGRSYRIIVYQCLLMTIKALACVTSTWYLGVIIDQNLTWKLHVNYVLKGLGGS